MGVVGAALAPIAEGVAAVHDMFLGREVPRHPGQSAKARLKQLRLQKTVMNGECKDLCEAEALRMRDLLGEKPAKRAAREAKQQAAATKAENAKTAKEENAKKRKADALETKTAKRVKVAAAKAESGSASSSTKPKPKVKAKAKAKAKDNQITLF